MATKLSSEGKTKPIGEKDKINNTYYTKGLVITAVIVFLIICYIKHESFTSSDGIIARTSRRQVRGDVNHSKDWDLKELEKTVSLVNTKLS